MPPCRRRQIVQFPDDTPPRSATATATTATTCYDVPINPWRRPSGVSRDHEKLKRRTGRTRRRGCIGRKGIVHPRGGGRWRRVVEWESLVLLHARRLAVAVHSVRGSAGRGCGSVSVVAVVVIVVFVFAAVVARDGG